MNKTALGFGIGLVVIAAGVVAYLAVFSPKVPEGTTPPATSTEPVKVPDKVAVPEPAKPEMPKADTPEPPKIPQPAVVKPTMLTLLRTVPDALNYKEKDVLDVVVRIEQRQGNDPVRAMGMQEEIPAGYVLDTFDGPRQPDVKPQPGTRGTLEFAWFQFAEGFFPAEFTYRIKKAGEVAESPQISGQVLFRTSGEELRTGVVKTLLGTGGEPVTTPAPAATSEAAKPEMAATPAVTLPDGSVPAAPAAPAPPVEPQSAPKSVNATVTFGRAPKAEAYVPGEPVEFDVVLDYEGTAPVSSVAIVDVLPAGWTLESVGGATPPPIKPAQGAQGNLSFIYIDVPQFPTVFSYVAKPPADADGDQVFKGKVVYRADNSPLEGAELVTTLKKK